MLYINSTGEKGKDPTVAPLYDTVNPCKYNVDSIAQSVLVWRGKYFFFVSNLHNNEIFGCCIADAIISILFGADMINLIDSDFR